MTNSPRKPTAADAVSVIELCHAHGRPAMADKMLRDRLTIEEVERRLRAAVEIDRACAVSAEQYPRIRNEAKAIGDILNDAGCSPASARAVLACIERAVVAYEREEDRAHANGEMDTH